MPARRDGFVGLDRQTIRLAMIAPVPWVAAIIALTYLFWGAFRSEAGGAETF